MRNGWCWERETPARRTDESDCGSWPTPVVTDAASAARHTTTTGVMHPGTTLTDAVRLWPTPTAANPNEAESLASWEARRQENAAKGYNGNGQGTPLGIAVRAWPTPTAHGHARGPNNTLTDRHHKPHDLETAVRSWPTPSARDQKPGMMGRDQVRENHGPNLNDVVTTTTGGTGTLLNPRWVEGLMGWPIGWTGLPASVIGRLRQEKRRASGKPRGPARAIPAESTPSAPSATDG